MRLVFDIEANGLFPDVDTIWCIIAKDIDTGEKYEWTAENKKSIETILATVFSKAALLVGHNILNYDLPLLKKLTGWLPNENTKITDTLVMSRLFNPDRARPSSLTGKSGSHSLEAWGYRVGKGKPEHEEWNVFSPAMLRRCREDVEINHLVYNTLERELAEDEWKESLRIEQEIARIMSAQERRGINFDLSKAREYVEYLSGKIREIDEEIVPLLPKTLEIIGSVPVNNPFLKIGGYRKQTQDYLNDAYSGFEHRGLVGGPFTRIKFTLFNIGSTERIKPYLLECGWRPENWNYSKLTGERTSPKLEGNFNGVDGEIPRRVKERITWRHRKSQIEGWLENLREDNRLPAGANPCGTNTGRMRHRTVVNIPKANSDKQGNLIWDTNKQKDVFGTQMRSLFIPKKGFKLIGHDASGLELRMLAHYMNDPDFTEAILNGDIHSYNQEKAGLPTRDSAKSFIYAFLYGAGDEKIGSLIGGTAEDGRKLKQTFLDSLPKLKKLINSVKRASGKGYLKGLDGRKVWMRRDKSGRIKRSTALNTLLQSSGAIVMKQSCIYLDEDVKKNNLRAYKVLDMHDEAQAEVHPEDIELYSQLAVNSVIRAGKYFNLNIPLDAEAKVGLSLAETH